MQTKRRCHIAFISTFTVAISFWYMRTSVINGGSNWRSVEKQPLSQTFEIRLENYTRELERSGGFPTFVIFLCKGNVSYDYRTNRASDVSRQLRQIEVLLKSAAALTRTFLKFYLTVDSYDLYEKVITVTSSWPASLSSRIAFEFRSVRYPALLSHMKPMFRMCSTGRLFIPLMFPGVDSAMYIDTDVIFMRPPEHLWDLFKDFKEEENVGMAPCINHYGERKATVPFYGKTGLNAGVMLMNLTRLSRHREAWLASVWKAYHEYKGLIRLADQDILNIIFNENPEVLHEIGCEWNYRAFQCSSRRNKCSTAETRGVSLLHGNALSFFSGKEMKLQVIFQAWERHRMSLPLSFLYSEIKMELKNVGANASNSKCANHKHIDSVLLGEFSKHI